MRQVLGQSLVLLDSENDCLVGDGRVQIERLGTLGVDQPASFGVQPIVQRRCLGGVGDALLHRAAQLLIHVGTGYGEPCLGVRISSMRLKVMMSSVRRGLAEVRDAIAPVADILGYEPVRFETFTQQPVPPRAVCVDAVKASDIYLLLLGELYGDPMPGTGLAPTEEEWKVARSLGKPIVVFKQEGITPEPRQAQFIAEVENYESGVWRGTFKDIPDLIAKLKSALASAAEFLQPVMLRALAQSVSVPWREPDRGIYTGAGTVLETHIVPIGAMESVPASAFNELSRILSRVGRDHGLFDDSRALEFPKTESSVGAWAKPDGRQPEAGLRVARNRVISIWESLPSRIGGSILDEAQLRGRVGRDLRIGGALELLGTDEAAVAIGLDRVDSLGIATGPTSMSYPFAGRSGPLRLEPSDSVPVRAIALGAEEIANELVARLLLRLNERH